MKRLLRSTTIPQRQAGAVAIEFVFIFPVFFIICYAIVVYGLAFLVKQNFTYASEEVLRSAIACEGCETPLDWQTELSAQATALAMIDSPTSLISIRPDNLSVEICCADGALSTCEGGATVIANGVICDVTFTADPLLDGVTFPGFGKLPDLPEKISGRASLLF